MDVDEKEIEDSSSDSSDDEDLKKLHVAVAELTQQVTENVYNYNSHVELISILREMAELDKLREARNKMAQYFPLTPALWMEWLVDEIKIVTTDEEKQKVVELFERAVLDYLSVDIWLEYVQFCIGLEAENDEKRVENIRKVFERSLSAVGLHASKGALLWEAFVEYEVALLSVVEAGSDSNAIQNQKKRIIDLFRRQLSLPLVDMDDTLERFKMWLQDNNAEALVDLDSIEKTFKKAKEKLPKIESFEETLGENSSNYADYLKHEKADGCPPRVQCLYERILCDNCLNPQLWMEYIDYVDTAVENKDVALELTKRSLRNCPWSCDLAKIRLRLLEKYHCPHKDITAAVEDALMSGLQQPTDFRDIWLTFLEYMRRRYDDSDSTKEEEEKRLEELLAAFSKAVDYLNRVENSDPECIVSQFWARIEAKCAKDTEKMRLIWTDILSVPSNRTAAMWLEYINLEMAYGDSKHLRKLFPRALLQVIDWPESIFSSWLNFERDEGTLESYQTCVKVCTERIKEMVLKREQEAKPREKVNSYRKDDGRKPRRAGLGYQAERKKEPEEKPLPNPVKRKRALEDAQPSESSPEKKKKTGDIVEDLLNETKKDHGVSIKHDASKDNRTIFISNLDYTTEEKILRDIFDNDGPITDVRLVKNFQGKSKGFGYIEFDNHDSAIKALKRDRQLINGRPMFVSKCDPDKETRTPGFRFSNSLENNKLFVRGLPPSVTEKDLRDLFGKFGDLKDVRLVTYRNGHSKGMAYVDYEDDVCASQAVLKMNNTTIEDKIILVAISNPPSRQKKSEDTNSQFHNVPSLGGGSKVFGARGRGRTQISFLPRTLALNTSVSTKGIENLSLSSPQPTNPSSQ